MRLLFFGSSDFSVPTLQALVDSQHEIAKVVTRPDRPRGRGRKSSPTAVARLAADRRLNVLKPETANSPQVVRELEEEVAGLGVVVAYGELLSPQVLGTTSWGFVNVHPSLLPDYRGAAPINWALIRGEEITGVSVIRMSPELDAGPVLAEREVCIHPDETAGDLHEKLARIGAEACLDLVNRLDAGEPVEERPQPEEGGFFARKLTKEDGRVDWALPADAVRNRVRGMTPWPGAYTLYRAEDREVRVTLLEVDQQPDRNTDRLAGTVVEAEDGLAVQTGNGMVVIRRLQPAGGREMEAHDFVNGYGVEPGDRFE